MSHPIFSAQIKLADMVHVNYKLLYVFPRLGITLGVGEQTVAQACRRHGVSVDLFLLICNVYTFDRYEPRLEGLDNELLVELVQYLRHSHQDYVGNRLPEVTQGMLDLIGGGQVKHGQALQQFWEKYRKELLQHFAYEESTVFPYINSLLQGGYMQGYSIHEYEGNHTNIEEALNDLKNILIKYLPAGSDINQVRHVLIDLFSLDDDLSRHTMLEDKVLIHLVENMEKRLK